MAERTLACERVAFVSNALRAPYDEGTRVFALRLQEALGRVVGGRFGVFSTGSSAGVSRQSLSGFGKLVLAIRRFEPDTVLYLPSGSLTYGSLLRLLAIRKLAQRQCRTGMIALQHRALPALPRGILNVLWPDTVLCQSPKLIVEVEKHGGSSRFISAGVDCARFSPAEGPSVKAKLRERFRLPRNAKIVLHIGHLSPYRNLGWLLSLAACRRWTVVLVGSSSTKEVSSRSLDVEQTEIAGRLRKSGVIVLDEYISEVEQVYQAADCYVFPTLSDEGCIGIPLSVLEAMACNLPVIATPFGGLPLMFQPGQGLTYVSSEAEFIRSVDEQLSGPRCMVETRARVVPYSWEYVANTVLSWRSCTS